MVKTALSNDGKKPPPHKPLSEILNINKFTLSIQCASECAIRENTASEPPSCCEQFRTKSQLTHLLKRIPDCDIISQINIGGRLSTLQPFSTGRFDLEGNSPRSRRFWGTFKFSLVPQNAQILGNFNFLENFHFIVFAHLVIHF